MPKTTGSAPCTSFKVTSNTFLTLDRRYELIRLPFAFEKAVVASFQREIHHGDNLDAAQDLDGYQDVYADANIPQDHDGQPDSDADQDTDTHLPQSPRDAAGEASRGVDSEARLGNAIDASAQSPPAQPRAYDASQQANGGSSNRGEDKDPFGSSPPSSAPPSRPSSPVGSGKKRKANKKWRDDRTAKRREAREKDYESTTTPLEHTQERHMQGAEAKKVPWGADDIPSLSTGYGATHDDGGGVYTLAQLLDKGFELVHWDGKTSRPLVDSNGLVVAVLVGHPNDPNWDSVHEEAFDLLQENMKECNFTGKHKRHRRGNFAVLNTGISFGGGPQMPGNLGNSKARTAVLEKLLKSKPFIRLAHFASSALATWMPNIHAHYRTCMDALLAHHPDFHRNFPRSVWAAAALNFGPRTVTRRHRDVTNLPYGVCSITALGKFDYRKGGHLVLWEFKLVIEFPPGSTVLIPSAAIAHSNTPIQRGETRSSFTQYSVGALFRWVDQGFQKKDAYEATLEQEEKDELAASDEARCALGLSLFSKLDDLLCAPKKGAAAPSSTTST